MSKTIFIVTHPEATHHVDGIVGGWFDSDLTERGLRHAAAIAESLCTRIDGPIAEIVTSDLLSARRAYRVIGRIQHSVREHQILVTHGGTSTMLIAAWIGMPIDAAGLVHFQVSPGSISVLRKDSRTHSHQVERLNDVSHLA